MRFLGLDVGRSRVGVALSDPDGRLAFPFTVINAARTSEVYSQLKGIVDKEKVDEVVVGLPLTLRGERGPQARETTSFADGLSGELGIPIHFWDERLSTKKAGQVLSEADIRAARRKQVVDMVAATVILQSYLDSLRERGES